MRLRIADRVLVGIAGILLLACCAGIVAQMFFGADLVNLAVRLFSSDSPQAKAVLIALSVILLLIGCYCVLVLFRHRKRKDKFILQKTDGGELAISISAMENMIQRCLDQRPELDIEKMYLENKKDGLLIRMKGAVAGGISIPLTVDSLQKQIRQYVTDCSGVEIRGIRVEIDSSGEDAADSPFTIAAPAARPLLREGEKKAPAPAAETAPDPRQNPQAGTTRTEAAAAPEPVQAPAPRPVPPVNEDDDRPLHQRLFSTQPEECFVPEPPAETVMPKETEREASQAPETAAENGDQFPEAAGEPAEAAPEQPAEAAGEPAEAAPEQPAEAAGEPAAKTPETAAERADPDFMESLRAFDDIIQNREESGK